MSVGSLNDLFKQIYVGVDKSTLTVDEWLKYNITEEDSKNYENALIALEIQNSPLYQVLTESYEPITKPNPPEGRLRDLIPDGVKLENLIKMERTFYGTKLNCPKEEKEEG